MRLSQIAILLLFFSLIYSIGYTAEFVNFYKGLPNHEKHPPFQIDDYKIHSDLRNAINSSETKSDECSFTVRVPNMFPVTLKSNICEPSNYNQIRTLVHQIAPSLEEKRITFWKTNIDWDSEPEILVGHIDKSTGTKYPDPYPYLSLWLLDYKSPFYQSKYAGPFLGGELYAIKPFGPHDESRKIFIRHISCYECSYFEYISVIDFSETPNGAFFEFCYSKDHSKFGQVIEFGLPGRGHSVDASVFSKIPTNFSHEGPHLLQYFDLSDGRDEWWVFNCNGYKCDYELYLDSLPDKFKSIWDTATDL